MGRKVSSSKNLQLFAKACIQVRAVLAAQVLADQEWLTQGRPETGTMRFGNDWSGVFIRGDRAAVYSYLLDALMERIQESGVRLLGPIDMHQLEAFTKLLSSSNEATQGQARQNMLPFEKCKKMPENKT